MNFIKSRTKITGIVTAALTIVALITFIMLSTLIPFELTSNRIKMCLIYSITLLLLILIAKGSIDLLVFKDYKCQPKCVCAEGVLNICLGCLLGVVGILFLALNNASIDIRWFLGSFVFAMSIWKLFEMIESIRHNHFDKLIDIISFILWIVTAGFIIGSIYFNLSWVIISLSWSLIVLNVFNIVFSYVIKTPNYLATKEAIRIQKEEQELIKLEKQKEKQIIKGKSVKANLEQLKQLYEKNLITQADYNSKKKDILNVMFDEEK